MATVARLDRNVLFFFPLALIIAFLLLNFNFEVGTVFGFLALINWTLVSNPRFPSFQFVKGAVTSNKLVAGAVIGTVAYGAYLLIASTLGSFIDPSVSTFSAVAQYLSSYSLNPALMGDPRIEFIMWALIIPIVETSLFFGELPAFLARTYNVNISFSLTNINLWVLGLVTSSIFALFHLSAGFLAGTAVAFILYFLFGLVSFWLVIMTGQKYEAIALHIVNNGVAMAIKLGIIGGLFL